MVNSNIDEEDEFDDEEDEFDDEEDEFDDEDGDFEEEDEFDDEDDEVFTISSSDVARIMSNEIPQGDERAQEFGLQFERAYQQICYNLTKFMLDINDLSSILIRFFSDDDDIEKAFCIAQSFLESNVIGLTPKTQFRAIKKDYYIAAKPDLYDQFNNIYYEFKTYKLDNYARNQAKIFSWVLDTPIHLIGWNDPDVEHEIIDGRDIKIPDIPLDCFSQTPKTRVNEENGPFHQKHHFRRSFYREFDDFDDLDDFNDYDDFFDDYDDYF